MSTTVVKNKKSVRACTYVGRTSYTAEYTYVIKSMQLTNYTRNLPRGYEIVNTALKATISQDNDAYHHRIFFYSNYALSDKLTLYHSPENKLEYNPGIPVDVDFEDGEYIFSIPELNLYSYSEDYNEGLEEINEEVVELYHDVMREIPENLGPVPKKWREILESRVIIRNVLPSF